jgi:hypothetical protein
MRALGAAVAVALAVGCSGGGDGGGGEAATTSTTVRRTPAVEVGLRVGQCGDVPGVPVGSALDPATLTDVDCALPHDVEVAAVFDFPAGPDIDFPGAAAVDGYAFEQCIERFEPYVGRAYEASTLDFVIVAPDEDGWDDGDRRLACVLYDIDFGQLTGWVSGSGR